MQAAGAGLAAVGVAAAVVRPKRDPWKDYSDYNLALTLQMQDKLYTPDEERSGCADIKRAFGISGNGKANQYFPDGPPAFPGFSSTP